MGIELYITKKDLIQAINEELKQKFTGCKGWGFDGFVSIVYSTKEDPCQEMEIQGLKIFYKIIEPDVNIFENKPGYVWSDTLMNH